MKTEAVIFDLGRVLVEVDLTRGIFKYNPADKGRTEKEILDILMQDDIYRSYAVGKVPAPEFASEICKRLNLNLDFESFKPIWNEVFKPIDGMEDLVKSVAKKYKIGLLSDIGPLHWEHLYKTLPVLQQFPAYTLSYISGVLKPDTRAYQMVCRQVGLPPEACLFIDDREENVEGAQNVGMQAIHFQSFPKLKQDLQDLGIL